MLRSLFSPMLEKTRSRPKREQKHFSAFLRKIRQCACVICGMQAEAAHVRMSSAAHGKSNGRDDKWVVPLCPGHHRLNPDAQHNSGEAAWWSRQEMDPLDIAQRLWAARDDLEQMQKIAGAIR